MPKKRCAFQRLGRIACDQCLYPVGCREVKSRHGITLRHVKLTDTASAVSRILAEKTAGRDTDGSVDLIWVNGENFASLKRNGLLQQQGWAFDLENFQLTDADELPGS